MSKKIFLIYFIFILFSFFSCNISFKKTIKETYNSRDIRVKLSFKNEINISLNNDIIIKYADDGNEFLIKGRTLIIKKTNNEVYCNNIILSRNIKVYSDKNNFIAVNGIKYLGYLNVIVNSGDFYVINVIPLETYLLSVLPSEVPLSFADEAVKAQAVVARTYAILNMERYASKRDFDVDDTVNYQVYKGFNMKLNSAGLKKLNDAVNHTKGLIVTYDNKPILAYFHANSGGLTRSGLDYFGKNSDYPYLKSHNDFFSMFLPGSSWEYSIGIEEFKKILDESCDITDNNFSYNSNGFVDLIHLNNQKYSSKTVRQKIGYSLVKSERFKVIINETEDVLTFNGIGYGHGVGMSQWGAHGMALSGFNYKEIIEFYYPGTKLKIYLNDIAK